MTNPPSAPDPSPGVPASPASAVIDGVDVDAVAAAVEGCPDVAGLYAGRFGEIGSYLPGRTLPGVQVDDGSVTIQIRGRWGVPAAELLHQIHGVTTPLLAGHPLTVVLADIEDPPADPTLENRRLDSNESYL